ncbi:tubulin folding cofactor D C terminal-domain-containing protein [Corynascus novoguineensis]|uniref:Tubulin folding cofactor D C terminal-domain-containing protein n=1 Tax=Corynascus novoguineensis TaxID=1126955 RepID=A0AAN7CSL1_9PEZI|nr:tubulin folding cofactor D C terminal-domain-containing protein [Corynascus novoguineensis]
MDAPEDDLDIKLQKISGDLIADFDKSLLPFLRKQNAAKKGAGTVRSRVRARETERLVSSLLDPFQELPQLLDPHLPKWLPALGDAFLEYHLLANNTPPVHTEQQQQLLVPLPRAICRLLYTFCKIRGEKVVVRFLSNEARYLELLLTALEDAEKRVAAGEQLSGDGGSYSSSGAWTWEERYIVLLWLSHLMLAPFDLSTMSSQEEMEGEGEEGADETGARVTRAVPGLRWPAGLPSIATRIVPLAIKYLAAPGKERDASKALLVRLAMRRDMQQLGVLDALVHWALEALRPGDAVERTPYHYIGVLSFLAGVLASSADTSDMDRYLTTIFHCVHSVASEGNNAGSMMASALARKTMIKVIRSVAVLILRNQQDMEGMEIVETTIGFLLESLADNDTPVRFAASKALSVITLRLDQDMASQVVEAVLESLNRNVLRTKKTADATVVAKKDLSMVDPLEWHGLMLTLSHLLYRRSPPADNLADIVQALLMGLSFERRSTSGSSTGSNVRDAACFGIWALARRYTTAELLTVPTSSFTTETTAGASILQVIATHLVAAACLDPSGNIRRGSSAALQELIGRHPDTVEEGIFVVQTVDYHAVALRARAMQDVALGVTKLSRQYGEAVLDGLLGWRGVGDVDTASRRAAGISYGMITAELSATDPNPIHRLMQSTSLVLSHLRSLETRQVEERHGLFFSLAAVLDALPAAAGRQESTLFDGLAQRSLDALIEILTDCNTKTYRKPELLAEAASRLIISSYPVLQAVTSAGSILMPGHSLRSRSGDELAKMVESVGARSEKLSAFVALVSSNLQKWLVWPEIDIINAASEAAVVLMIFCTNAERDEAIRGWADAARARQSSKTRTTSGHFSALAAVYPLASTLALEQDKTLICDAITERWRNDTSTDTRACILQSLAGSDVLRQNVRLFSDLLGEGLDDYTTTARGDVGSHVRFAALRATRSLWERLDDDLDTRTQIMSTLFLRILRLAAEKLDRVRAEAQAALAAVLKPAQAAILRKLTFSSTAYFVYLLDLLDQDWLHPAVSEVKGDVGKWMDALMAGIVSSADTGNEELVIATRAALCAFCERSSAARDAVCTSLVRNLKAWQGTDRVLVPTLEVLAFLFHVGVFADCCGVNYKNLCLQVQKACYKTGNVRKIEACIRVYGAVADLNRNAKPGPDAAAVSGGDDLLKKQEGIREARTRLGALLFHPWPRVRSTVVDELWVLHRDDPVAQALKSVHWGKAEKAKIKAVVEALGLASAG